MRTFNIWPIIDRISLCVDDLDEVERVDKEMRDLSEKLRKHLEEAEYGMMDIDDLLAEVMNAVLLMTTTPRTPPAHSYETSL